MSAFSCFAAGAAQFHAQGAGESMVVTPAGGSPKTVLGPVLRDQLMTRVADKNARLEYSIEVQIPIADYPAAQPTLGADTVALMVRVGDTVASTKTVTKIIAQVAGMWYLGLD